MQGSLFKNCLCGSQGNEIERIYRKKDECSKSLKCDNYNSGQNTLELYNVLVQVDLSQVKQNLISSKKTFVLL